MTAGEIRSKQEWGQHTHPCIAALHVWVALIVPGCVHICLHFAVGAGSSGVCMFHVLILISILVWNCEVLWVSLVGLGAIKELRINIISRVAFSWRVLSFEDDLSRSLSMISSLICWQLLDLFLFFEYRWSRSEQQLYLLEQIGNGTKPRALVQNQHTRELISARKT